jgi:hypothetical protein
MWFLKYMGKAVGRWIFSCVAVWCPVYENVHNKVIFKGLQSLGLFFLHHFALNSEYEWPFTCPTYNSLEIKAIQTWDFE